VYGTVLKLKKEDQAAVVTAFWREWEVETAAEAEKKRHIPIRDLTADHLKRN
jgi:hypothetical protein